MTQTELLAATAGLLASPTAEGAAAFHEVPRRRLGTTGVAVSSVGLDTTRLPGSTPDAVRLLRRALEGGLSVLRINPELGARAEPVRQLFREGLREKALLLASLDAHASPGLDRRIDDALTALDTDCLDLLELEAAGATEPGLRAMVAARKMGKVRLFGLTGCASPVALLRALAAAAEVGLRFDSVGLPLDLLDPRRDAILGRLLPVLMGDQVGIVGTVPVESTTVSFGERIRFALTLPASTVLLDLATEAQLQHALRAARAFRPYSEKELHALLARAALSTRAGPRGGIYHPADDARG